MTLPLNYEGRVSIHVGDDSTEIIVYDQTSGVIALQLELPSLEYLRAMTRGGERLCKFWLNQSERIGATCEVAEWDVKFDFTKHKHPRDSDPDGYRTPAAVKALRRFEVDGWEGNARDLWNGHNTRRTNGERFQIVRFVRYVKNGKMIER